MSHRLAAGRAATPYSIVTEASWTTPVAVLCDNSVPMVGSPKVVPVIGGGQERPPIPTSPPASIARTGSRKARWSLSRHLTGYKPAPASIVSIGGKAPKWVLINDADPDDFYIAKLGSKNGRAETLTELFNNHLGSSLGFQMAHFGLARLDGGLYFVTKNFRTTGERLVHGSLMIEEVFGAKQETERIKASAEQSFYGVDFLKEVIDDFCSLGETGEADHVFSGFVEMLVFDALIGSMDRHAQNWGVLQTTSLPPKFRFSPIYDSARALMWGLPEQKLPSYADHESLFTKYITDSKPCIGPSLNHPKINHCNHFDLIQNLRDLYPHQTEKALRKISTSAGSIAGKLLKQFPYTHFLSALRRKLMLKLIYRRADLLRSL
jgi:hypothetical protein